MIDYTHLIIPGGYTDMEFFNAEREGNECHISNFFIDGHSIPLGIIKRVVMVDYNG